MLTRRRFLGTVAALAAGSRVATEAIAAAPVTSKMSQGAFIAAAEAEMRAAMLKMKRDLIRDMYADEFTRVLRRDDGDTLLELR
jgi:hypothetical protein